MNSLTKPEILRLVSFANRNRLTPMILFGTRKSKQDLIQSLSRYWNARKYTDYLQLKPIVVVPPFRFYFHGRHWNFESVQSRQEVPLSYPPLCPLKSPCRTPPGRL